uniref:Apelin receptor early endogenous ligand n=2 Tax=Cyprinus carpio TaxID=7962 RepID=A0A8C1XNE2_CYPCA
MSVITRTSDCYIALQIVCYQLGRPLILILFQVTPQSGEGYFLNLRRKYRRHNCPKKRCLPLHSRVPFP